MIGNRNIITYICEHMHQQCDYVCGVVSCVTAAPPSSQGWMYLYFPSAICSRCILWPRSISYSKKRLVRWFVDWFVRNVFYPTKRKRTTVCALDFQKKVRFSENILDFCLKIWRSGIRHTTNIKNPLGQGEWNHHKGKVQTSVHFVGVGGWVRRKGFIFGGSWWVGAVKDIFVPKRQRQIHLENALKERS